MTDTEIRDEFLARRPRFAMLASLRADGSPITVPVWFDWDGQQVSMFCGADSPKLSRISRDPRVSILVANDVDESEYWVSFEGSAEIERDGGFDLAERLADRYWNLDDSERANTLELWRSDKNSGFRKITLAPTKIRTYQP